MTTPGLTMVLEGNRFSVLFEYPQSIYTYGGTLGITMG